MQKWLEEYMNYLLYQRNYSIHTIRSYQENLDLFFKYLKIENLSYNNLTYQDIRPFFNYLANKKYSNASTAHIISSIRGFYKFLNRQNVITLNPFALVSTPKQDKKIPKFLYYDELEILFQVPDLTTSKGIRDRLILELLYATGMRASELVSVKVSDIDFSNKQIKILGKGNKERYVYFGDYALEYLNLYLNQAREKLLKHPSDYLLINNKGTPLETRGVRVIINDLINKSSLDTKISPHALRHTFATHLLNEGCDILSVQELLGHQSLKATQIYTHVTDEKLKNVYLHTHPRSNKKIDENTQTLNKK